MDKKPIILMSILTVVLLVLGSLSNVVGYQSVKSTVIHSPLFQTRTQRATNQQQNTLTSQYLGMGKRTILQFPFRDNTIGQLKEAIDIINKMDEKTFAQFTEVCIQRSRQDKSLKDMTSSSIVKALNILKTKSVPIINPFINNNNQYTEASGMGTICYWFPGCIYWLIMCTIGIIIYDLFISHFVSFAGPLC
jgi:hypothetical protein